MFDDAEGFHGRRAHTLGGGVGGEKLGVFRLQFLQFPHQLIVFGVGNLGAVEHVVAVVVVVDFRL